MNQAPSVARAGSTQDHHGDAPASISLRGTTHGLEILVTGAPSAAALGERLTELLAEAPSFFAGSQARVAIDGVLPLGALACLEQVAAQFALQLVEIGPVVRRRRRLTPVRITAAVLPAIPSTRPSIARVEDAPLGKLAEGSGPIAEQAAGSLLAGPAPAAASAEAASRATAAGDITTAAGAALAGTADHAALTPESAASAQRHAALPPMPTVPTQEPAGKEPAAPAQGTAAPTQDTAALAPGSAIQEPSALAHMPAVPAQPSAVQDSATLAHGPAAPTQNTAVPAQPSVVQDSAALAHGPAAPAQPSVVQDSAALAHGPAAPTQNTAVPAQPSAVQDSAALPQMPAVSAQLSAVQAPAALAHELADGAAGLSSGSVAAAEPAVSSARHTSGAANPALPVAISGEPDAIGNAAGQPASPSAAEAGDHDRPMAGLGAAPHASGAAGNTATSDASLLAALAAVLATAGHQAAAAAAVSPGDAPSGPRLVIGPVRSGRIVDHHGHLIIIGDVNPGAEVRAEGSIIVLGRLRGVAHAAIGRDAGCIIALSLQPQQLRIGRMVARAGDADRPSDGAEIAYATGETIVVERFLGRLPSGLAASM